MIKKYGTNSKITKVIKDSAFALDPNLVAKQLIDKWPNKKISLDQLHEAVKSIGVLNYESKDMTDLVGLLQSAGFTVVD
jgi:hypothetical protein